MRAVAWLLLAFIFFVTISPIDLRPSTLTSVNLDRALAYAFTGMFFSIAYPKNWKTIAMLLVLGAAGFEFLQEFQPTRHARMDDALVKASGALLGIAIGCACSRFGRAKADAIPVHR